MKKGFTLIEILMGTALFAIVFTVAGAVLVSSLRSSRKAAAVDLVKSEGAFALRAIADVIRYAEQVRCISPTQLQVDKANFVVNQKTTERIIYTFEGAVTPARIASTSGVLTTNLTSERVAVSVANCGGAMFTCLNQNRSVNICFSMNNAEGVDVTDMAGTNGMMFQTQTSVINTSN